MCNVTPRVTNMNKWTTVGQNHFICVWTWSVFEFSFSTFAYSESFSLGILFFDSYRITESPVNFVESVYRTMMMMIVSLGIFMRFALLFIRFDSFHFQFVFLFFSCCFFSNASFIVCYRPNVIIRGYVYNNKWQMFFPYFSYVNGLDPFCETKTRMSREKERKKKK